MYIMWLPTVCARVCWCMWMCVCMCVRTRACLCVYVRESNMHVPGIRNAVSKFSPTVMTVCVVIIPG